MLVAIFPLFHNSCLRPLQLCCYCLVTPLRRPPHHSCSTRPMSPAQHRIFCWSLFFSFSSVSLIKPSLDQPGGSSSGFVCKQPGVRFCSTLLLFSSRPASTGHHRPQQPGGFPRVLFPSSLEAYPWVLFASSLEVSSGFVSEQPGGFPRVLFPSSLEAYPRVLFASSLEVSSGFVCQQPGGFPRVLFNSAAIV